jgi:hypothetical protein
MGIDVSRVDEAIAADDEHRQHWQHQASLLLWSSTSKPPASLRGVDSLPPVNRAPAEVDLLLMPTTPMATTMLPGQNATREEVVGRAFEMIGNTAPTRVTGHPAISVPVGKTSEGPPNRRDADRATFRRDDSFYRAAAALEGGACRRPLSG